MAFDAKKDGFVTLDDLKSIIIHFTIPVSDQLFQQLMERYKSHKLITSFGNFIMNMM